MSSRNSTAIFVSDQSHQGPPFLAPPSSVEVSGPSAFSRSRTAAVERARSSMRCQRCPLARNTRRRKAKYGHSSIGSTQAACDQYSKAWLPDQYAAPRPPGRPRRAGRTGPARASGPAPRSCRAAPRPSWRSMPRTPARRSGAPSSPWARSAMRRASSALRVVTGLGGFVMRIRRRRPHRQPRAASCPPLGPRPPWATGSALLVRQVGRGLGSDQSEGSREPIQASRRSPRWTMWERRVPSMGSPRLRATRPGGLVADVGDPFEAFDAEAR